RSKRPCHHPRELCLPECVAVRAGPLLHDNVRTCIAQRVLPPSRVLEEERLSRAGDQVRARNRTRHDTRRSVTSARGGAEDRTIDIRMPEPDGEREFSTRRDTEHGGTAGRQCDSETRPHPLAYVLDEEPLVRGEPLRVKAR